MASPEAVAAATGGPVLDIAEWSFFWTGVERTTLPGGTSPIVLGEQMYVEYQIPAKIRHPYPIVLVHGGGGQGLDWMGTPDGRRGWATMLLEEGYKVYVVDRPGSRPFSLSSRSARRLAGCADARIHLQSVYSPKSEPSRRADEGSAIRPTPSCTISGREPARSARPS